MKALDDIRIAGERTIGEWKATRAGLADANNEEAWSKAHTDYFMGRLRTRYFDPIDLLGNPAAFTNNGQKPWRGEGFAIVALQCSLIEFLGATLTGQSYVNSRQLKGRKKTDLEYTNSGEMFVNFLHTVQPFNGIFGNKDDAWDFYVSVRCGLLHEARTRNNWKISSLKSSGACIDVKARIVYRNNLQDAFVKFTEWYRTELIKNKDYQAAFIRKFDSLCVD